MESYQATIVISIIVLLVIGGLVFDRRRSGQPKFIYLLDTSEDGKVLRATYDEEVRHWLAKPTKDAKLLSCQRKYSNWLETIRTKKIAVDEPHNNQILLMKAKGGK